MKLPADVQRSIDEGMQAFEAAKTAGNPGVTDENPPASQPEGTLTLAPQADAPPQVGDTPPSDQQGEITDLQADQTEQRQPNQPADDSGDRWEQRYRTLQGKYDRELADERRRADRMQGQIDALLAAQQAPRQEPKPEPKREQRRLITQEEINEFGPDLVDMVGRRAQELYDDKMAAMEHQLQQLKSQLGGMSAHTARTAQERVEQQLAGVIPDWDAQNRNPEFNQWLAEPEPFSGIQRMELLRKAYNGGNGDIVVRFFQAWRTEKGITAQPGPGPAGNPPRRKVGLDTMVSPGRGRAGPGAMPRDTSQPRAMTQAEITQHYKEAALGRKTPEETTAFEQALAAAMTAGLVQGAQPETMN